MPLICFTTLVPLTDYRPMSWQPSIQLREGKEYVFCEWRRRFVRLTPEEWVRQSVLHSLVEQMAYPKSLIAVEHFIEVGTLAKRCDAVVFSTTLQPLMIIEFKAEDVRLTQKVFDQVAVYNRRLRVRYLMVSNGHDTYVCSVDNNTYTFFEQLPTYQQLCQNK